jgi:hypothetical protein
MNNVVSINGNGNDNEFDSMHAALKVALQSSLSTLDEVKNLRDEMKENTKQVRAVADFMLDFYNEYRQDDRITTGQKKSIRKAMHERATAITKISFPALSYDLTRKSDFYKEWNKIIKGLWSIYRHMVNENACGYDETPKIKYNSAIKYIKGISIYDYRAYRSGRWKDINSFVLEIDEDKKITMSSIVDDYNNKEYGLLN